MSPLWYSVRKIMSGDPRPTSSDAVNGWMSWPGDRTVYRYSVFVRFSSLFCWRTFFVCENCNKKLSLFSFHIIAPAS